jgi:hypothetical protein
MADFTVEHGKSYQAKLLLQGLETWASNEMVAAKFGDLGFVDVKVTGSSNIRVASGTWTGNTATVDLPSQVLQAEELTANTVPYTIDQVKVAEDDSSSNDEINKSLGN